MDARIWLTCAAALTIACGNTDSGITTKVKSQFATDDVVKAYQIDVDTRDHVVTLTGTVESEAEEAKAIELARNTNGVTDVVDRINVEPKEPAPSSSSPPGLISEAEQVGSDAWITSTVKTKLLADDKVGGLNIDVDTSSGMVTLTGTVSSAAERNRAIQVAKGTEGVKGVNDRLTIKKS